ncbi:hypothetical protein GCM10011384_12670 [Psychrobacillus lasiicapitis]|nr:hypothetical protein GCM10011384_12670 [Psychrobacillus lasiicapitis]
MIASHLDFNTFAAGGISIYPTKTETYPFVNKGVLQQWHSTLKNIDLNIEIDNRSQQQFVFIDQVKVEQILVNVAQNARHAMKSEGFINITIQYHADTIELLILDRGHAFHQRNSP